MAAVLDGEDLEAPNPRSHALSVTTSRYEMQKVSSRFIDRCAQSQRSSRRELRGGPSHHGLAPRTGSDGRPHPPGPTGPMQAPRPAERGLSGESASHSEPEPPTKHYSLWQGSGVLSKRFPVTSGRGPAGREAQGHSFHQRIRPHLAVHERAWKKKKKKIFFFLVQFSRKLGGKDGEEKQKGKKWLCSVF